MPPSKGEADRGQSKRRRRPRWPAYRWIGSVHATSSGFSTGSMSRFTTTGSWTRVEVSLPVKNAGHDQLKLEVYEDSVGNTMFLDAGSLS